MRKQIAALILAISTVTTFAATPEESASKAKAILEEALTSRNPDTRRNAVAALSLAATSGTYLNRIIETLEDKDVAVRLAAIAGLTDVKAASATTALRKALNDETPEVSFAAAKVLWARRDAAGKQALMAVLEGENKTSSNFLSKQKREALRMMHTPRTALLFAARQGATFAPIPGLGTGISSMQNLLSDPEVSGQAAAALLLGQQRDAATTNALIKALMEGDASVRAAAVHSLALQDNPSFRQYIEPLLQDDKEAVRLRAAAAYIRLSSLRSRQPAPAKAK